MTVIDRRQGPAGARRSKRTRQTFPVALTVALILLATALFAASCGSGGGTGDKGGETTAEKSSGVKPGSRAVLIVLPQSDFQDIEYSTVRNIISEAGYQVMVATVEHKVASGVSGTAVTPDLMLSEAKAADFLAVIFIGGPGAESLYNSADAHRLAVEAVNNGRVLAAICIAPVILARAGVLKGRRATVFPPESRELTSAGAEYTGEPVEKDGKLITADGPRSSEAFARAILEAL